jgi:hypothetical protein
MAGVFLEYRAKGPLGIAEIAVVQLMISQDRTEAVLGALEVEEPTWVSPIDRAPAN